MSQLDRKFKRLFQLTPQQFLLRVRLNAACQMLGSTDRSVSQIALGVGFYDQSYFTKHFRRQMGMTPRPIGASTGGECSRSLAIQARPVDRPMSAYSARAGFAVRRGSRHSRRFRQRRPRTAQAAQDSPATQSQATVATRIAPLRV